MTWNPRGEPTWPNFRDAVPGKTRVRHNLSDHTGTFLRWPITAPGRKNPGYAVIEWDDQGFLGSMIGRVVAYAYDLSEIY